MGPDDVRFTAVREVSPAFHARFSALWRRYEYRLSFEDDLFLRGTRCLIRGPIDRDAMDAACAHVVGRHDFRSFCKTMSWKADNHCDVAEARFAWDDGGAVFHIRADRFLHHMVRTMVGTLLEVGRGTRGPDDIPAVLAAHDRGKAGIMAPPQGLYLAEVGYPDELMDPGFEPDDESIKRDDDQAGPAGAPNEETP
jgi:tRNA pseudouridine38-40 synthase